MYKIKNFKITFNSFNASIIYYSKQKVVIDKFGKNRLITKVSGGYFDVCAW